MSGLGAVYDFEPSRIVPDDSLSLSAGAIVPWAKGDRRFIDDMLAGLQQTFAIDPQMPFGKLPKKLRDIVLFGAPGRRSTAKERPRRIHSARTSKAPSRISGAASKKAHGPIRKHSSRTALCSRARCARAGDCDPRAGPSV